MVYFSGIVVKTSENILPSRGGIDIVKSSKSPYYSEEIMNNRWTRIYAAAAAALCVSVIGMIVSGEGKGAKLWLAAAVAAALVSLFARWKIGRNASRR
jgi:hypothetical protein